MARQFQIGEKFKVVRRRGWVTDRRYKKIVTVSDVRHIAPRAVWLEEIPDRPLYGTRERHVREGLLIPIVENGGEKCPMK